MNWYGSTAPEIGLPISMVITAPTPMPGAPRSAFRPTIVEAARDTARAMLTFCQGYIVRAAVLGQQDLKSSISAVELLMPSSDHRP